MARRGGVQLPRFLTFGDRVPPSVGLVLALMLVMSVWGWLEPEFQGLSALSPVMIVRGQVWRLVSWPFVQSDPFALLFGGFMIWWLGQQLSFVWSEQRFLRRFFGYAVFASVATTAIAYVWAPASAPHAGIWPVANALLVSWAILHPDRQLNFWGVLPLTGRTTAWLVLGGTVLYGIAAGGLRGIGVFTPHLTALLAAWLFSRGLGVGGVLRDARGWLAERDGEDDRPRWLN